ncbi:MAG: 5-carboxymethyl-2-hydroxymuconate Delta-isomerase [Gammaproteobacteria bacterium]|nr:5-carboxymethyl-2-hydroxymuconate Delta-isomerase [Gammaproteobacteria bacterium]
MPHCVIEYAREIVDQVSIEALMAAVHDAALSSDLFPEYEIKTRAIAFQQHRTGQTQDSFVHVGVHLLLGRDDDQKADLSERILAGIEPLLADVVSVGVEIIDMHRASYRKRVLG